MRVWVDITNSPHVAFFRPLLRLLAADGHEVEVTARDVRADARAAGAARDRASRRRAPHGGAGALGKARAMAGRLPALRASRRGGGFDLALAHGSHEAMLDRAQPRDPGRDRARLRVRDAQHQLGLRAATRVVFPDAVPPERLARYGAKPPKLVRYPGIEEEYYLADFEPDRAVLDGIDPDKRARGRADAAGRRRSTTGTTTRCSPDVLERLGRDESVHAIVLPRTGEQRDAIRSLGAAVAARPGARGRRPEPRRARRSRRLGRRDDEPRGGGARHARLHDLRGPARRRRRGA